MAAGASRSLHHPPSAAAAAGAPACRLRPTPSCCRPPRAISANRSSPFASPAMAQAPAGARCIADAASAGASASLSGWEPVIEVDGLSDLLARRPYRAALLDQFGVLHDGQVPYSPRTVEAVRHLASAGVRVYIISNSSRRSSGTIAKLSRLGFDPAWFEGAVTSGDMAHEHLLHRPDEWWRSLGSRCVHFTWSSRGTISLEGLSLQVTSNVSDADFILAHGTEAVGQSGGPAVETPLDDMKAMMAEAAARKLPMIVANPDVVTVNGPGSLIPMPGMLAKWYGEMGGTVTIMGKPAPVIYEAAMSVLGLPPAEVIAIGDSLEHDVAGAAAAGIDSLFIAGGIHAADLGVEPSARQGPVSVDSGALAQLCERHGASPTYLVGFFEW